MREDMGGEAAGFSGEEVTVATPAVSVTLNGSAPPPFLSKTYDMVDDPAIDAIVSWGPRNNSFVVWNVPEFSRDLLPKHFKHNNFSSFVRQLNTYGFRKVDADKWEFANAGFLRGQKHLLKNISRRKPSNAQQQQQQQQPNTRSSALGACVEVGKLGLEEEIERLKRDKNILMQELVRLRQQQQGTDHQLQTLTQLLHGMEQRQQQMMSFLAKAMQSPSFLAQLVQQNDGGNRRIVGVGKKRRLPKEEKTLEGQIVKYQPLMTEAAKALLMQILKLESSSIGDSEVFFVENRKSGVTLKEVPSSCRAPYLPSPSSSAVPEEAMTSSSASMTNGVGLDNAVVDDDDGFVQSEANMFLNGGLDNAIDTEMNVPIGDESNLPCINDSFWEQFLVETEEINVWNSSTLNMEHLTEQMGFLSPQDNRY